MLETNWPWKLNSPAQNKLDHNTKIIRVKAGATIYKEGATSDMIFRVIKGKLRVFKMTSSGKEISLFYIEPGQVCPLALQSCLLWKPIMASAVAVEDTEIACVPAAEFAQMLTSEASVAKEIIGFISASLKDISNALQQMGTIVGSKKVQ